MKRTLIPLCAVALFLSTAAFAAEPIKLRVGMSTEIGGHYHSGAVQFKERVEKYTEGKVKVDIFPSSQLGNERDMIEGAAMGLIEMCVVSTGPLPNFSPDFMVFDFPFLVIDRQKAYAVMDGEVGQAILKSLEPKGIKALGFWENGFRNITNNKKAISRPEDVKGMKIRTMENPLHQETFRILGATPTPMAWGEVFIALQQGTIDGQENPLVIIDTAKIYEVQKHISLTGHFYSPAVMLMSKQVFDELAPDIQEAVIKAEKEARDWERAFSASLDTKLVETLKEKGAVITEVNKEEWRKACAPVYDLFRSKVNPAYLDALLGN
jgi:tripartite ATP-independent transporter DctP family solute receptor